ncbi:unnamed protein product [Ectocarpus sp. 6 AP-2014]
MATTTTNSKTKKKKKRKKKADITTRLHEVYNINTLRRNDDKLSQPKFQQTTCLETVGYSEV